MAARKATVAAVEEASVRSIYIKVKPTPTTLAERRAVLRAIQRYGGIEVFKRLRDPSSFISVTAKKSTVEELVERSPLRYEYVDEEHNGNLPGGILRGWHSADITPPVEPVESSTLADEKRRQSGDQAPQKSFALHIFPTTTYKHKTVIRYSPLHGPWAKDDSARSTFTYAALRDSVPDDHDAAGLRDWQSGGQLANGSDLLRLSAKYAKLAQIEQRRARAVASKTESDGMAFVLGILKDAAHKSGPARPDQAEATTIADRRSQSKYS